MNDAPYNYPYCEFDFTDWNPVQQKCKKYFTEDCNLVVSASTASGKTVIAQAIMGYELSKENSKVVYVSPLKAIGLQKFEKWNKHATFKQYSKILLSSQENVTVKDLENSQMIISTVESMNVRCRLKQKWIKDIKVIIFDESHLINDKHRGAGSQAMIIFLSMLNPNCRLVCLSGTMSNYIQIAKWLKSCNNKSTKYVNSNWRPTELIKKVQVVDNFNQQKEFIIKESMQICFDNQKMLIFVYSKKIGEKIYQFLHQQGIICAFYHANLKTKLKDKIINDFKNNYSNLNVLICTSSLGAGVDI